MFIRVLIEEQHRRPSIFDIWPGKVKVSSLYVSKQRRYICTRTHITNVNMVRQIHELFTQLIAKEI